ncbi:PIG-L family deacetylase [Streptomyces sp. G44]|uniref:PIG-L deacetylase family protein n=1 Tax=Streptomyces sp. G44 TaxID=2807632 RepID=UPI001961855A|nr:PIG-L deacetylase family protein [Streptomyces sp. G44]MBM7169532.1 PIG-L family deacetylase [Streptomyces sp. G44]
MTAASLLAVFAHPDDESLMSGGVLARHAAAGARTAVVTATWAPGTGRALELAEATRILGAGEPRLLGFADARTPDSAPGEPRFLDAPLDEAVGRLVAHIRDVRPDVVITHDAYGGLSGHPDHVHTHRVTVLAAQAAGLERLCPEAGAPWHTRALYLATHPHTAVAALSDVVGERRAAHSVPDAWVTATVDVGPWLDQKVAAVLAHRGEVDRGAVPALIAALAPEKRARLLSTEWYIRHQVAPVTGEQTELSAELSAEL